MQIEKHELYGLTEDKLLSFLDSDINGLKSAIAGGYKTFYAKDKNGKMRKFFEPNDALKKMLQKISKSLQSVDCPEYCKCGWPNQNALQNAQVHLNKHCIEITDIKDYYCNTRKEFVAALFKEKFCMSDDTIKALVKMTTNNDCLPIGAPTSTILAFLCHKDLFDKISEEMKSQNITWSLYADDITLSANFGITYKPIRLIQSILDKHSLKLNRKKTKIFSYKKALVTGFYIHQNGKITVPYWIGHTVIKKLKETPLDAMSIDELQSLLGYINYQRKIDKQAFKITRIKALKRLEKLQKESCNCSHQGLSEGDSKKWHK